MSTIKLIWHFYNIQTRKN